MKYQVFFDAREEELLAGCIGETLETVRHDGWSAELQTGEKILRLLPEEFPTPSEANPYADVSRPCFDFIEARSEGDYIETLATGLGKITAVFEFRVTLVFSLPEEVGPREILPGVQIPAGKEYGPIFFPPDATDLPDFNPAVDLDLAAVFYTEPRHAVALFTDGFSFFVRAVVDEKIGEDWIHSAKLMTIADSNRPRS